MNPKEVEQKKKKKSCKWAYSFGDDYPGLCIGHKTCRPWKPGYAVPGKMGWLWNATDVPGLKFRRGWTPGAIGKTVAKLMTFKCARGGPEKDKKKKKKRRRGAATATLGGDSEPDDPLEPKPTLKVQRKGDTFTIQVSPLKDLNEIGPFEDPYVDCDPLVFKIIKKRSPEEQAQVEAKKLLRMKRQRDAEIRKGLAEATEEICKCAYMDIYCNDLSGIDKVIDQCPAFKEPDCLCEGESLCSLSSNATWDIEYTPPFGCFDLAPRKPKRFIHVETQYCLADTGYKPKKASAMSLRKPLKAKCICPCECPCY